MSMILDLYSLSDAHVHAVLADPPLVWEVLGTRHPALRALGQSSSGLGLAPDEVEEASLDKAWHGIHYLLTGSAWEGELPLGFICQGGSAVGDIDLGYGPARAFSATEVKALDAALAEIDAEKLAERFDPDEMEALDIYPSIWDEDEEALAFCVNEFATLKDFIARTAQRGFGMLLCMG
jgi:hypothetical protein